MRGHGVRALVRNGSAAQTPPRCGLLLGGPFDPRTVTNAPAAGGTLFPPLGGPPPAPAKAPAGCDIVVGDPFDRRTFTNAVAAGDTFLQLVGVPRPSPAKARQFVQIDLRSAGESIRAARAAAAAHFVYVSVAQPAPVMR